MRSRRQCKSLRKIMGNLCKSKCKYCQGKCIKFTLTLVLHTVEQKIDKYRNCLSWAISPFSTIPSKVVCCRWIEMCLYVEKGQENIVTTRNYWTILFVNNVIYMVENGELSISVICSFSHNGLNYAVTVNTKYLIK